MEKSKDSSIDDELSAMKSDLEEVFLKYRYLDKKGFEDVTTVIKEFSERTEKKPTVMIMGDTSSGKSSFLNLLLASDPQAHVFDHDLTDFLNTSKNFEARQQIIWHFTFSKEHGNGATITFHKEKFVLQDMQEVKAKIREIQKTCSNKWVKISLSSPFLRAFDIIEYPNNLDAKSKSEIQSFYENEIPYLVYIKDLNALENMTEDFLDILKSNKCFDERKRPISIIFVKEDELFKLTKEDRLNLKEEDDSINFDDEGKVDELIRKKKKERKSLMVIINKKEISEFMEIKTENYFNLSQPPNNDLIDLIMYIRNYLEKVFPTLKKKFLLDNIHALLRKVGLQMISAENANQTNGKTHELGHLIEKTCVDFLDDQQLKSLLWAVQNKERLQKDEPQFFQQLRAAPYKNNPDLLRSLFFNLLNERVNQILKSSLANLQKTLSLLLCKQVQIPEFSVHIVSRQSKNKPKVDRNCFWLLGGGVFTGLGGILYWMNALKFFGLGLGVMLAFIFISKSIKLYKKINYDMEGANIWIDSLTVAEIFEELKGQLIFYLKNTMENCREKEMNLTTSRIEKIEKNIERMKENVLKGK